MLKSLFGSYNPQGTLEHNKKRFSYIDAAYFIGVILVVFGHSHPLDDSWWHSWYKYSNAFIYTFHMQLYFFVAGYLLIHSHSIDKLGYKKWAFNKLLKFGIPYFVLTVVAYVPKAMLGNTSDQVELSLGYFIKNTFFVPRLGVWGHFWFIAAFVTLDLIWGLWRAYAPKNLKVYRWGLIIGGFVSIMLAIFPIRTDWFTLFDISQVAIFYFSGILLAFIKPYLWNTVAKNIIGIFPCLVVVYFLYPYGNFMNTKTPIINFIVGFCLVWICWSVAQLLGRIESFKLPAFLSKLNFTIFLYSWPAQATVEAILRNKKLPLIPEIIILFIVGFTVPLIITFVYTKCTFLHCAFFDHLFGITTLDRSARGIRKNEKQ